MKRKADGSACLPVGRDAGNIQKAGEVNSRNSEFQFWRQDNQPKEVYSPAFAFQKLNYIHNNPVEAGIVSKAEHYLYSSAMDYFQTKKCGLLDVVFL